MILEHAVYVHVPVNIPLKGRVTVVWQLCDSCMHCFIQEKPHRIQVTTLLQLISKTCNMKLHVGNITYQLIYFRYFTISCLNVWRIPNQIDRVIGALNYVTLDLTIYLCSPILCLNKVSLLDEFWWCDDIRL